MAPLCIGCQEHPVRRRVGGWISTRGLRMVDGIAWRWFCSRPCASRAMGTANKQSPQFLAATQAHRQKAALRALTRLVALVQGQMDAEGKVDPKTLMKAFMEERALAYSRGYSAGLLRRHGRQSKAAAA